MTVSGGSGGSDRRLVVYENNATNPDQGRLIAIDPSAATGIALPAFEVGRALPSAGTVVGQGYHSTAYQASFIWSGSRWEPVAPSPIKSYTTEAQLLADTGLAVGTYAVAQDTGSMYVMRPGGWTLIGIATYATLQELLVTTPAAGSMGEALDEGSLWEMTQSGGWRCMSVRELPDTSSVLAWANGGNAVGVDGCNLGDRALAVDVGVSYIRTGAGWVAATIWQAPDEATIRAAAWAIDGQEAIAVDTGRLFVRRSGSWIEEPVQHYPTEAQLLAQAAPDGTLAWGDDSNAVYARSGGTWVRINGDRVFDPIPIGAINAFAMDAIPSGWLPCDGSAIPSGADYDELRRLLAPRATVPDLRGRFLRGRRRTSDPLLALVGWSTGAPRARFEATGSVSLSANLTVTGSTTSNGTHSHGFDVHQSSGSGGVTWDAANKSGQHNSTENGGDHSHTVNGTAQGTVTGNVLLPVGGGDSETAPDHATVIYAIKALHSTALTGVAPQFILSGAQNDDVLRFDATAGVWVNQQLPLGGLADVTITAPQEAQLLTYDATALQWVNRDSASYTKAELDAKLQTLVTGLEHAVAVQSIATTPSATPVIDEFYIVDPTATGAWAGHAHEVVFWDGLAWQFATPRSGETRLVEDQQAMFSFNGTVWVKVSASITGSSATTGVGEILPWLGATVPAEYLPCDGRVISAAVYASLFAVLGNTHNAGTSADGVNTFALPDLRGMFLRGYGANGGGRIGEKQGMGTAPPQSAFVFSCSDEGDHLHNLPVYFAPPGTVSNSPQSNYGALVDLGSGSRRTVAYTGDSFHALVGGTSMAGRHHHAVAISSGGDGETRPKNVSVNWIIRHQAINGGAKGDKGDKGDPGDSDFTVGDIKQSVLSETQFQAALPAAERNRWVLADGRAVPASRYEAITGNSHVPDLRGAFLRMSGRNAATGRTDWVGGNVGDFGVDQTKRPNTAFTGATNTTGGHTHSLWSRRMNAYAGAGYTPAAQTVGEGISARGVTDVSGRWMDSDGDHSHTVTIDGGGDNETRPKHFCCNYFLKIN